MNWKIWNRMTLIFQRVYQRVDTVMLTAMKGYQVTGWYNAGANLINALTFIPMIIINATFPAMSRLYHFDSKDFLKTLYKKSFYYILVMGVPLSIGITMLSQRIILFIYKAEFIEAGLSCRYFHGPCSKTERISFLQSLAPDLQP